jgi:D-tyrosyl-tRNA(Tyr) deacylase
LISESKKGRRHTFFKAAAPAAAEELFDGLARNLASRVSNVELGVFGADMTVSAAVRGPLNLVIDDHDLI